MEKPEKQSNEFNECKEFNYMDYFEDISSAEESNDAPSPPLTNVQLKNDVNSYSLLSPSILPPRSSTTVNNSPPLFPTPPVTVEEQPGSADKDFMEKLAMIEENYRKAARDKVFPKMWDYKELYKEPMARPVNKRSSSSISNAPAKKRKM